MGEHRLHACAALAPISKPRSPLVPRASSRTSRRRSIASQNAADYATRSGGVFHLSVLPHDTNRLYDGDNLDVLGPRVDDESVDLGGVFRRGQEKARAERVRAHV